MTGNNQNIASVDYQRAARLGALIGYHHGDQAFELVVDARAGLASESRVPVPVVN